MPFKRRPRFVFQNQGGAITDLVCDPRSYVRARRADGRTLWAPCLAWAPGPNGIASPGDGSYADLFGKDWLLQMCVDGSWVIYINNGGSLESIPWDITPPLAGTSGRHPTLAFDQAARPAIAWEEDSGILLREYNEITGTYHFIGPFAGKDPVLMNDAIVNYRVGGSDVILFYLNEERDTLLYRIQHENFANEYVHYEYDEPVVLDAAQYGGYQFQLKYSNAYGQIIDEGSSFRVLMSDVYPIYVQEHMIGTIEPFEDGEIRNVVIKHTVDPDYVEGTVGLFEEGEKRYVIIQRSNVIDEIVGTVGLFEEGEKRYVIIQYGPDSDHMIGAVDIFGNGAMIYTIIQRNEIKDSMIASVGVFKDGAYVAV